MSVVQLVLSFESLHPDAASGAIQGVFRGPFYPDAPEQRQAASSADCRASGSLIQQFGNAGNRGVRI